ncbi:protein geranylgeranyltransferase type I beta subunit [Phycomyces blakesleeanus]|uniref:Geranylgeranyl transferase type-1 subunit beta n=1 Tax=Phycomyces blakesleeanus TaxID=4837 RepID=A0ABR3BA51_PHYBL
MTMTDDSPQFSQDFTRLKHITYFKTNLSFLPNAYTTTETNRMTLGFFCLNALDLLGALDESVSEQNKKDWIEWIYAQQLLPETDDEKDPNLDYCGFRGSSSSGRPFDPTATHTCYQPYDSAHIANTYTALLNLLILGDDLSRVNIKAITRAIRSLQQDDGSIAPTEGSYERDVRFIYCATAICYILDDWSGLDMEKTLKYIQNLQSYEHAIGQSPGQESHGGSTFCGVGALELMGKKDEGISNKEKLIKWCLLRQSTGFEGRPNKNTDTCYCFWIGAALKILGVYDLVNHDNCRGYLMTTQSKYGGFGKEPDAFPDVMHSYMGIAALSLLKEPGIKPIDAALNVSAELVEKLKKNK